MDLAPFVGMGQFVVLWARGLAGNKDQLAWILRPKRCAVEICINVFDSESRSDEQIIEAKQAPDADTVSIRLDLDPTPGV